MLAILGYKVPEMTDHNDTNPYIRNLRIFSGMNEQLHYYVDNAAREAILTAHRLYKSSVQHAKANDYQIIGNLAYSADVRFTISATYGSDITIPAGTILSYGDIQYVTQTDAVVTAGQTVSTLVTAEQYIQKTGISMGVAAGIADEEVVFTDKVVHDSISMKVATVAWSPQTTLGYSLPTDKHYVQTVNEDGNAVVYFGNEDPYGLMPSTNDALEADYKVTLGADGYAPAGAIDTIVSSLTLPGSITATVTNPERASGGSNVEDTDSIKRHIPVARRTLERAVRRGDFAAVAELAPGVQRAGEVFNCGKALDLYISPVGGGIASSTLIADTQTFMNTRNLIGFNLNVYAAGEVHIIIVAAIKAVPGYANSTVSTNASDAVVAYMAATNQQISGTVVIGDIYQKMEAADGVLNAQITAFYPKPYARPTNGSTPALVWTPQLLSGAATTIRWAIEFTGSTTFRLIRSGTLIGTYSTGALVSLSEISFTIPNGAYSNGNSYEFFTYPYVSTSIALTEPSLPVSIAGDITLTVTGGI